MSIFLLAISPDIYIKNFEAEFWECYVIMFKYWSRSKVTGQGESTGISRTHQDTDLEQKYEQPSVIFSPFTMEGSTVSLHFCVLKLLFMSIFSPSVLHKEV